MRQTKAELFIEIERLSDLSHSLRLRHDFILQELCEISENVGNKSATWWKPDLSWDHALRHKAAKAVETVAKMRLP